jgi:transcriptional regulator with XRE-family HTH domain
VVGNAWGIVLPRFSLRKIVLAALPRYDFPVMQLEKFAARVQSEFQVRRTRNPRYSLRAFASFLGTDHSTLSQMMRGKRPVPVSHLRVWAKKLGLDDEEILAYLAAEEVQDVQSATRQHHLKHWAAEASSILAQPIHWEMLRLSRKPDFRPDSRYVAEKLGVSADEVNVALSRLLRLRLLKADSTGAWSDATGLPALTEASFRKLALARVREQAGGLVA